MTQLLSVDTTVTDMDEVVNACTVTSALPPAAKPWVMVMGWVG